MSAAVLEKLGTPFFTTRAEGNGLGVVLARTVITQHGGKLEFASAPGSGTTATVHPPRSTPHQRRHRRGTGSWAAVLLVDDDPGLLFALSEVLEAQGHQVVTAESGQEALGRLDDVDVVVTDLAMPGMSGLELLDQVLAVDPALPVLLLTAHGSEKTAVAAMKRGAYDYFSKPFDNDEVSPRHPARAGDPRSAPARPPEQPGGIAGRAHRGRERRR